MIKEIIKRNEFIVNLYENMFEHYINPINYRIRRIIKLLNLKIQPSKFSFGEQNADKKIAILKKEVGWCGPFAYIFTAVYPFLLTCKDKECVPLIDIADEECLVFRNKGHKGNPWEFYFEQPSNTYTLNEAYKSKNVIVDNGYNFSKKMKVGYDLKLPIINEHERAVLGQLFRQYIRPCKRIVEKVESKEKNLFKNNKILGVSLRSEFKVGENEKNSLFKNHPKAGNCDEYIEAISKCLKEWNYDYFFLACDGREWSDQIKSHFGDKCLQIERPLIHWFENSESEKYKRETANYPMEQRTEDYLIETLLLTRCDSLYGSVCGQSRFAYIYACDRYKNVRFDDRGRI